MSYEDVYKADGFFLDKSFICAFQVLLYLEFAETKLVTTSPKSRRYGTMSAGNKVLNDTNETIFVVDSCWDTTIKTSGFPVRGFFRWQPVGPGRNEVKLIWIDEFIKQGYTRTAGKEIFNRAT
jgi:hypothetical protein